VTPQDRKASAEQYIDRVIEVNRRHGATTEPKPAEYEKAVKSAASAFAKVRPAK